MKIFKFGGASVKNADAVRNVGKIINLYTSDLLIVISAMGKTTNSLERIHKAYIQHNTNDFNKEIEGLRNYHDEILNELEFGHEHPIRAEISDIISWIDSKSAVAPAPNNDYEYDQIVSLGEVISTKIVSEFLNEQNIQNTWTDARSLVRTDNTYREGKVDWEVTKALIQEELKSPFSQPERTLIITQGFLGSSNTTHTTTLGREGSDYSAAIFAWCLDAEDTTIWKDVPGVLNADPKWFDNTQKLDSISFKEAIELSYYGATIIHPKTIKPLQNKNIPLNVKSFIHPDSEGTVIQSDTAKDNLIPSFIFKMDQVLLSLSPTDFSFIIESNLRDIFDLFDAHNVKINMMQNSAISFSVCVDNQEEKTLALIEELKKSYLVKYNTGMELVTIRHYDQQTIDRVCIDKKIYVEQKSRHTARMVMKDLEKA